METRRLGRTGHESSVAILAAAAYAPLDEGEREAAIASVAPEDAIFPLPV